MVEVMAVAAAIGCWVLGIGLYHLAVVLREKREREQRRRRNIERIVWGEDAPSQVREDI